MRQFIWRLLAISAGVQAFFFLLVVVLANGFSSRHYFRHWDWFPLLAPLASSFAVQGILIFSWLVMRSRNYGEKWRWGRSLILALVTFLVGLAAGAALVAVFESSLIRANPQWRTSELQGGVGFATVVEAGLYAYTFWAPLSAAIINSLAESKLLQNWNRQREVQSSC